MRKRDAAKLKKNDYVVFRGSSGTEYVGFIRVVPKNLDEEDFGIYSREYGYMIYRDYKEIQRLAPDSKGAK
jgi:hypothetical protein